ncbi:MAG: hypothetical protein GXX91_14200 [Verrucomicrobiaceae bacterium]|nr:hypothetical protein [Verrucomicrobiaceae bacterium]
MKSKNLGLISGIVAFSGKRSSKGRAGVAPDASGPDLPPSELFFVGAAESDGANHGQRPATGAPYRF